MTTTATLGTKKLRQSDFFRLSVVGLRTRKLRSGLSALGIAIGVAAIVAVLGLSASAQAGLLNEISALGTNLLVVQNGQTLQGQPTGTRRSSPVPSVMSRPWITTFKRNGFVRPAVETLSQGFPTANRVCRLVLRVRHDGAVGSGSLIHDRSKSTNRIFKHGGPDRVYQSAKSFHIARVYQAVPLGIEPDQLVDLIICHRGRADEHGHSANAIRVTLGESELVRCGAAVADDVNGFEVEMIQDCRQIVG